MISKRSILIICCSAISVILTSFYSDRTMEAGMFIATAIIIAAMD
jgi:hypothetical protein